MRGWGAVLSKLMRVGDNMIVVVTPRTAPGGHVWDAGQILTRCWPLLRLRRMPICPRTKQHDVVSSINVQSIRP